MSDYINIVTSSGGFAAGTKMLFVQTAAPTGWTKDTDQNDKALRIVSGTVSTGGTSAFSTVFAKTVTDAHTLVEAEMPAHTHNQRGDATSPVAGSVAAQGADANVTNIGTTGSTGGGGSHTHGMDIRVQYVDVIKATKD